jgi:glycosyltransferase involved in cell wall biosynthesis
MLDQGLSIIIPVYNEVDAVLALAEQLEKIEKDSGLDLEIIMVNDGSDDGTAEQLAQLSNRSIRVMDHPINRGYGAALKTGIAIASHSLIAITDADGTYPNEKLPELYSTMIEKKADMVVGARTGSNVHIPLIRRPPKWALNQLANYLTGTKIPDLNSGFRIMRKKSIEKHLNILPDGFSFTTTITLALLKEKGNVIYMPIDYADRKGKSKIRPIYDTLNFLQLIIRSVMYFDPLAVFLPLSIGLVALAFVVLFASWFFLGKAMDVTFGVMLMTGVMVLAIGMLADFIDKRTR